MTGHKCDRCGVWMGADWHIIGDEGAGTGGNCLVCGDDLCPRCAGAFNDAGECEACAGGADPYVWVSVPPKVETRTWRIYQRMYLGNVEAPADLDESGVIEWMNDNDCWPDDFLEPTDTDCQEAAE